MGSTQAAEMAEYLDLEDALAWHLQVNHYPPIPEVFDAALLAIEEAKFENWDGLVPLPDGVTWRDQDKAPVWACVEGWHLEVFI